MKLIKEIFKNTIIQVIFVVMVFYNIIILVIIYNYNNQINRINEINKYKIDSINKLIYKNNMKTLPIEKEIVNYAKSYYNNKKIKIDDILEWNLSEDVVSKNLRDNEIMTKMETYNIWFVIDKKMDNRDK